MKVSRALQAYWEKEHKFEVRLQQEAKTKSDLIKKAAKQDLEVVLYEKRRLQLYLIKCARQGKNIDREV